jgi:nucleoside-triphosphatase THEP1
MFRTHGVSARPSILAIVYADGVAARRFICDLGHRLRDAGVAVAGIVPYQPNSRERSDGSEMEVEDLASRIILQLSDDSEVNDADCRLDPAALHEAAALISAAFRNSPDLVILNKFGRLEVEGEGLRDVISDAVELGIPVVVGVPERHIESWRTFTNGLAEEASIDSPCVHQWLSRRRFDARGAIAAAPPLAATPA